MNNNTAKDAIEKQNPLAVNAMKLDAHEKPPERLRAIFKKYRKFCTADLETDPEILDLTRTSKGCQPVHWTDGAAAALALETFNVQSRNRTHLQHERGEAGPMTYADDSVKAYQLNLLPGLFIIPSLLPVTTQRDLLATLLHRDLQNPAHKTNVHLHHQVSYPEQHRSFFSLDPSDRDHVHPKDPSIHRALDMNQFLNKKLRWVTLGGQYDWTNKTYPDEQPPSFPSDIAQLLRPLFPQTRPEAAIVNLYSPGDTLSLHRDVSESCDNGLISISIGCDALFIVGSSDQQDAPAVVARLRSGDALYMTESARFAWHGIPRIIPNTCPGPLRDWPYNIAETCATDDTEHSSFTAWRGWMTSKRINLNVRQMQR